MYGVVRVPYHPQTLFLEGLLPLNFPEFVKDDLYIRALVFTVDIAQIAVKESSF